jgi:phosphatidylinositol dimannoside acyltransferase
MATLTFRPRAASAVRSVAERADAVSTPRWHTHRWNRVAFYRLAGALAIALPRPARLHVAGALGDAARLALPAERRAVRANLARVLAGAPAARRAEVEREVFRHFAFCLADTLATGRSEARRAQVLGGVAGGSGLDSALAGGSGLVVLTAHLGNWELGGRLMADRFGRTMHVVMAPEVDPGVERYLRVPSGAIRFVTPRHPTAALGLVAALRRGEIVAVQGDRALGDRTDAHVSFFGVPARFPLGPFVLARAAGAPVVPAFCVLGRDRRYRITLGAPLVVGPDGEPAALARWVDEFESAVGRNPEQWFNFFSVWDDGTAR